MAGAPASAQMDTREGIALQNQILELRRDMQALRDQIGRGAAARRRPAALSAPEAAYRGPPPGPAAGAT